MKRFPAVLFAAISVAALAAGMACGGDKQPQLADGPADDIGGTWSGTYLAYDGSQSGIFCAEFDQDSRGITGEISFDDGEKMDLGGVITNDTILLTWGAGLQGSPDPALPVEIGVSGGTMNGTSEKDTITGTWISAASADVHGDWSANRLSQFEDCGE